MKAGATLLNGPCQQHWNSKVWSNNDQSNRLEKDVEMEPRRKDSRHRTVSCRGISVWISKRQVSILTFAALLTPAAQAANPPTIRTWNISCLAPQAQEVQATLYLAQLNTMSYRVEKVQYNEAGKIILENGKGLPAVKGYHDRYLKEKQVISRPAFHSMIWAWKTFGSKFQWGPVTYHCQIS